MSVPKNSLGKVVILPLIGSYKLTFSGLEQLILDQTGQNEYQTVPLSVDKMGTKQFH